MRRMSVADEAVTDTSRSGGRQGDEDELAVNMEIAGNGNDGAPRVSHRQKTGQIDSTPPRRQRRRRGEKETRRQLQQGNSFTGETVTPGRQLHQGVKPEDSYTRRQLH